MRFILVTAVAALVVTACSKQPDTANSTVAQAGTAAAKCNVQGAWLLDTVIADGKVQATGKWKQIKLITASHYAWVGQEGGVMPLKTVADSLAAFRTRGSGGGTYRVTDSMYIERLDMFSDPERVGREVEISCRPSGNRWEAAFDWTGMENGKPRTSHVKEIWKRVEP